jgi:hypothetical protein
MESFLFFERLNHGAKASAHQFKDTYTTGSIIFVPNVQNLENQKENTTHASSNFQHLYVKDSFPCNTEIKCIKYNWNVNVGSLIY